MKSLNTIQKLSKIGKVLSKIAFIFSVIGFCGCIAGFMKVKQTEAMDMYFDNESSIVLGIMFILGSLSPVYLLTDHVGFYEHYGCSYVWFKATEKLRCRECTCISNLRQLVCNVSDWRT